MPKIYEFPKDFLWGTATSAHQIEGNNTNSDWWHWENSIKTSGKKHTLERSGIAEDSYNRYKEDLDLCVKLNNNAYRFSVEWARIEPKENQFDQKEIEHYRNILKEAKKRKLKTFVTLQHFTLPLWFAKKGGWRNLKSQYLYTRYARKCTESFGDLVDGFMTINEPQVYIAQAYLRGVWPPHVENPFVGFLVQLNLICAHNRAYTAIKKINPKCQVGIVKNICWFDYVPNIWSPLDWLATKILFFANSDLYLSGLKNHLDFIGLNYYFTTRIKGLKVKNADDIQSDLGWWVYPTGLEKVLLHLKKYNLPIYVTENGVADQIDRIRNNFIRDMLIACHNAIKQGVKLKGYFYWSLLDNYEWVDGFGPKFGLVYIDRNNNLARIPRESFYYYANICKSFCVYK